MKIMASSPITPWEIDGKTVTDFILRSSRITADGDCSHEIKRCLLLGRKVMTNLDSILKSRDLTLPKKVCLVKAMVFLVVMHGCESWTVKKAEHQRIDAFELWCWRRLLRVPWTARRSSQSVLKEISPEYSLEGLMLLDPGSHTSERVSHWNRLRCTVQFSHPYITTGKTMALTRRTFVGTVMSLLLNMLSRWVITFLPRSKCLLLS